MPNFYVLTRAPRIDPRWTNNRVPVTACCVPRAVAWEVGPEALRSRKAKGDKQRQDGSGYHMPQAGRRSGPEFTVPDLRMDVSGLTSSTLAGDAGNMSLAGVESVVR